MTRRTLDPASPNAGSLTSLLDPTSPATPGRDRPARRLRAGLACLLVAALALLSTGCPTDDDDDLDDDGIVDAADACPKTTPLGAQLFDGGCALTDFILTPEALTDPLEAEMDALADPLADEPMLASALGAMDDAAGQYAMARDAFRSGSPCDGATALEEATSLLTPGSDAFRSFLAALDRQNALAPKHDGDMDELTAQILWWRAKQQAFDALLGETALAGAKAGEICSAIVGTTQLDGLVDFTNPDKRTFHLETGQPVVLSPMASYESSITEGVLVNADVTTFNDGSAYTGNGTVIGNSIPPLPGAWDGLCLQLRIRPVGLGALTPGQDLRGYQSNAGTLILEQGMNLVAYGPYCPQESTTEPFTRYAFRLRLSYANGTKLATLASSIIPGQSASLPADVDPTETAQLLVDKLRYTCQKNPYIMNGKILCNAETVIDSVTYPVAISEKYGHCEALYDKTAFTLPPSGNSVWQPAKVFNLATGLPAPLTFHAEADKLVNGQPAGVQPIGLNQTFAVYPQDWYLGNTGTNHSSAIRWPHVTGFRNNQPFRYACAVPELVRDRIAECAGLPDTYYRLPFQNNQSTNVGQGNNTYYNGPAGEEPSHWSGGWQNYALDLGNAIGTPIVAARAGTVVDMKSNVTIRCIPDPNGPGSVTEPGGQPCPSPDGFSGNYVAIEHADGDWSWAFHMDTGSPAAAGMYVGKKVARGEKIGEVGLTGNTTGPHTHFHVTPGAQMVTEWVRYQYGQASGPSSIVQCAVPQVDNDYWSNNLP